MILLPPSGITLHSVFGQSQTCQILTKHIGKTINNYETKYMQYENIFYDNSNDGYFILLILIFFLICLVKVYKVWLWLNPECRVILDRGSTIHRSVGITYAGNVPIRSTVFSQGSPGVERDGTQIYPNNVADAHRGRPDQLCAGPPKLHASQNREDKTNTSEIFFGQSGIAF
jgi:hypothetical protein